MKNRKSYIINRKSLVKILTAAIGIVVFIIISGIFLLKNEVPFPNARLFAEKSLFKADESPKFRLTLEEKTPARNVSQSDAGGKNNNFSLIQQTFANGKIDIETNVFDNKQEKTFVSANVIKTGGQTYSIEIPSSQNLRPGKYTLETIIKTANGQRNLTQDFSWGVLAVNTNKSIYNLNETAKLSFSVLNEGGFNICDAELELKIQKSNVKNTTQNSKATILSTKDGGIKPSLECFSSEKTYLPDYFTTYQTNTEGVYQMELKATTKNGQYEIKDYFEVRNNVDFDVERISATRINPVSWYEMKIKIKANKDFEGKIVENLPYAFGAKADNNGKVSFDKEKYTHTITWDKTILQGDALELSYTFKAPEKSPEFYLLGPLTIQQFNNSTIWSEARFWQIAADPTKLMLLWDNNSATPSGWTCVSCSTGDTFFQKFIRGAAAYSAAGGGTNSHTATVNTTTVNATTAERGTAATTTSSSTGHAHSATTTPGSANNIPAFRSLRVISFDAGIPSGANAIPSGAIALFDATVPTGWTRYSAQDGNYVRGDWTITTGGSNTHSHTVTWGAPQAATGTVLTGTTNNRSAPNGHTHTAPGAGTTNAPNHEPPFIETILGQANSATSIPIGMIGMFDGPPGVGWSDVSQSAQPFNNTFFKPAATYSTTGGSATHTHTNVTSGATGGPSATGQGTNAGTGAASEAHTHTITTSFSADSNLPAYVDVQMAKKAFGVSGTVRQSDESTAIGNPPCDSSTGVIDIRINGGTATTISCSSVDSTYSVTPGTVNAGDIITILLNGSSTPKANTIIRAGTSDATSADLYQNVVVARSDDTSAISNANVCTFTTSMLFTCSTNNITVNSGVEFHAGSGIYTAGATLTTQGTGNLHVASGATATLDTGTSIIANNVTIDNTGTLNVNGTGGLTVNGGSITVTGTLNTTSGTPTVTMGATGSISGGGNATFYNLSTSGTGTTTYSASGTNTVNNNVSVGTGTTLNLNSNISIAGSLTNTTTGIINHTANSPVVTVSGTSIGGGSGNITFYRLQKAGAGTTTFSGSGTNTINNTLDATAGTLTLSTNNVITVTGNVSASTSATLNQNTALTINGGNLLTAGTGVVNTTAGTGTVTITGTGNIGEGGAVTVYALAVNGSQTAQSTITANNSISVGSSGTFTLTGQNINSAGNFTNTTTGVIACSGTTGTVTMTGGGTLGSGNGNITFCNLATTTTGTTNFSGGGTNAVNNNVSVGTATVLNLNSTISITGNLTNATSGVIGTSAGTPTVTVSGTTIGGGTTGAITFYNLTKAGAGTTTFANSGTNTINNDLSVSNGAFTQSDVLTITGIAAVLTGATFNTNANLIISGGALTTAGTGVVNTTAGTGTVTINGTGGNIGGGGTVTVYNLTLGGSGTQTLQSGTTANNDVSVGTGKTLSLNNQNLTVGGGDLTTTSTGIISCTGTTGTATVNGTAATGIGGGAGAITFCNLTIGGTVPIASAITVNNDMANNGTTSGSVNVTVNGSVAGTGSVNMSGGTFKQRVATGKNFGTTSTASTWVFSTLTLSNSSGSPITITTQSGGSGTITTSILNIGEGGDTSTTTLDAANRNFVISGGGTPVVFSASSGITASTSTFTYTGTGSVNLANISYYSLATNGSGTYLPASSPLIATNNVAVTLGTLSLGTNDLNVGSSSVTNSGGISVAGTLSQSASATTTIVSSSAGTATVGGAGTITFYNLTFAPAVASAPTFTLGSGASQTITINNDLTVGNGTNGAIVTANTNNPIIDINGSLAIAASGTFTAPPSSSFTIATNMTNNGTFNNNSGTVTFDSTNTSTFAGSGTPAIQFNNFTSIIPNKTLSFTASKTFRIDGVFTVTGTLGNRINIQSTSGTQWLINLQGTSNVTSSTVTNSGCAGGTLNVTLNTSNADGGNNGTCWVFSGPGTINSSIQGNTRIQGNVRFK